MAAPIEIDVWQGEIAELEVDALVVGSSESLFMTGGAAASVKRLGGTASAPGLMLLLNPTEDPCEFILPESPDDKGWEVVVDTDDAAWRGNGHRGESARVVVADEPWQRCSSSGVLDVAPMSMVWLAARSPG